MTYASEVLADSPLLYWPFNSGGTDASGNSRSASGGVNGTSVAGLLPSTSDLAVQFNGSSQYLTLGYGSWMNTSAITLECWVKTSTTTQSILVNRDNGSNRRPWQLKIEATTGQVSFVRIYNSAGTVDVVVATSATAVNNNVAHHVAATYDGTTCLIYIDGVLDSTTTMSGGLYQPFTSGVGIDVARYTPTTSLYYGGVLDELAWYGTALSSTRIAAHYAASGAGGGTTTGTFSATLPTPVTAAFTGTYRESGTFSATLPQVTASLSGTYTAPPTGDFAATLPSPLTTDFAGTYTAPVNPTGSFAATLPMVAASFAGDYHPHEAGTFDAVLPFPTADFAGTYTPGLESGSFAATLPVVTADFAGTYTSPSGTTGTFAATLPLVVAAFTGTYDGPTPTDTSNALNGRVRRGSATVTITRPVATVPPSVSLGQRYDKALAFPEPVMVDGRPT